MTAIATHNEQSTRYITAAFTDSAGSPVLPTGVRYRVDCVTNNQSVTGWTVVTPATSVTITIKPSENVIINDANAYETKRVTVEATYGVDDKHYEQHDYYLLNFAYVT